MNSLPARLAGPSRRWLLVLGWAGLAALMGGCASQPGVGDIPTELQTAADESDARKRARTRLALAMGYYENGQHMVALDEQKRAVLADPAFADAYNLGGLIYLALGENALALANFERAISLNPRDANALHNLGWLHCQAGRYGDATQAFQRAIAVPTYQDRARTLMAQGICEARGGDTARAEATLMRSYELDAGNPVTAFNLAQLLYNRGDFARAQFYIRRLNNSELANAESLWLGIKVERRLSNRQAMEQLASQLRRRFAQSRELASYERGAFNE
ncbi:MAG: type IV pilus biogenesis/stability protein PilW [Pseudomonadota bacterium]|nr:type IV pilus biogenesis/stability protein PilW [Pseudomonadota bacterium]